MKAGWELKKLGDVCDVIAGQSPEGTFYNSEANGLPFYQGKKEFCEKYIGPPKIWTSKTTKEAEKDDVLMSVRAPVGPINFATQKICIGRGLAAIRAGSLIHKEFLFNFLLKHESEIVGNTGAVFDSINKSKIELINIFIPPLPEQKRIVSMLDEAFESIATAKANAQQNLKSARELFESYLQDIFGQRGDGWVEKPLGEIATFRNGINFTKSSKGESIKILGVKDFQNYYWAPLDNFESVTPEGILPDSDLLKQNDLIFVRSNGNPELIGRCLLIGEIKEKTTHSGFTIRARLNSSELEPNYLCHFLKSHNVRREMIDGGNGANIRSLNQGTLSGLVIPFPVSSKDQALIVKQLEIIQEQTQHLESIYQQKISALDELKKSLLHKAFSGEL